MTDAQELRERIHDSARTDPVWQQFLAYVAAELEAARGRLEAANNAAEMHRVQGEIAVWKRLAGLEGELKRAIPVRPATSSTAY